MQKYLKFYFLGICALGSLSLNTLSAYPQNETQYKAQSPQHTLSQANHLIKEKRYDESLELLTQVINQYPYHVNALKMRAHVYFLQNNDELALRDFEARVDLRPNDPNSYIDLAIVLYRMKNYDSALEHIDYALSLRPKSPFAFKIKMLILKDKEKAK